MEEDRTLSRTADGRAILLQRADALFPSLAAVLSSRTNLEGESAVKQQDNAAAIVANMFSEDASGKVLDFCQAQPTLLSDLVWRLRNGRNFVCVCVALSNAWKQSRKHRQVLSSLGLLEALVEATRLERHGSQALGALRQVFDELDDDENSPAFDVKSIQILCAVATTSDEKRSQGASRLLATNNSILKSCNDDMQVLDVISLAVLRNVLKEEDKVDEELLQAVSERLKENKAYEASFLRSGLLSVLKTLLQYRKENTADVAIIVCSEICAYITQISSPKTTTAVSSSALPDLEFVIGQVHDLDLDGLWLEVVKNASKSIPYRSNERARDQSQVLGHARTRLNLLTSLLHVSTSEARSRRLLSKGVHETAFDIAVKYGEYDLEATRCCCNLLRLMTLADSRRVILETSNLTFLVSTLLQKSPDHHTAFIATGIFRTACSRSGKTDSDSWSRLVVNGADLVSILSIDLVKTHPHARVELARAFAALMEGLSNFGGSVPALETTQAVKFVSFLFEAPQPELHLEALHGIGGLPDSFLSALPSFEIEIVPGTRLVDRLKDIYRNSKDDLDYNVLSVASACQNLLIRMGVNPL